MDFEDGSLEDEAFIAIANELLDKCNVPRRVTRLEECDENFFVAVYKGLLGDDLPGLIKNPITVEQRTVNCQIVISLVGTDFLNVDLSHISGKGIVDGDKVSIRNFLEVFAGLLEHFMDFIDECNEGSYDEHDSNLLTSEHDVISGVLREEFGPSYHGLYGPRPQMTRQNQFSEEDQHQSRAGSQDPRGNLRRPVAGNSTGFDADTSKLSDSREVVSDSTGELIRLGESTSDRGSSMATVREETRNPLPDSTSGVSASVISVSQEGRRISHSDEDGAGGGANGRRSMQGSAARATLSPNTSHSQRTGAVDIAREPQSSLLNRDAISLEDDLTQYTLTTTELEDSLATKDLKPSPKSTDKHSSSFLSASSVSVAWPEQISPLEPSKDSVSGAASGFDALGVRPREQPVVTGVTADNDGSRDSSGRSTPVYHHYHHHFHHTQPQGRVPAGFQSSAGESAAATVDVTGPTSHLLRSKPAAAATVPGVRAISAHDRLTRTAPGALTHPLAAGGAYPSAAIPRSTAVLTHPPPGVGTVSSTGLTHPPPAGGTVSSTGLTHPLPAGVTETTSTMSDSVFFSGSGSSRRPVIGPSTVAMTTENFIGTASLRDRLGRSLTATTATSSAGSSLPVSSTTPSTSYRPHGALGSSLAERAAVLQQADKLVERLNSIRRGQPLASTYPGRPTAADRPQTRITDLEPSTETRRSAAAELLAKNLRPEADESGSESERELEEEELAQNSDSAVDYGSGKPAGAGAGRTIRDLSTSRSRSRTGRSSKSPRIPLPQSYKDQESTEEDSSPERPARRGVTFRDTVETFPVSGRMDRLRRLLYEEAEEQRKQHTKAMRKTYRDQLREIQQEQEKQKAPQQKRKMPLPTNVPKKKPKKKSPVKKRGRLEAVYRSQVRKSRPVRKTEPPVKGRKRSASASPVLTRRRSGSPDHPDILLPAMLEEFPFLHVSPQTAHSMWQKQARHLSFALKSGTEARKTKTQRNIEEAERRQEALVGILKKDLDHNLRMREKQEREQQQRTIRSKLRDKRQISARARRYYDEYALRMRSRMLKRRTREEQIFKKLFEDGLDIQKQRIRELREYAKEKREALAQRQQNEIESLENFYRDQFALVAEGIARERFEMEVREKAQDKVVRQMRNELRHKLEHDVTAFQENLQRDEDSAYFRQLEADRLRGKFQLATRNAFY